MDTPMGQPTVLTPAEEQLLVSYILHMAVIGFPLTVNDLFTEVQKIVMSDGRKHKMKDGKPGELWRCWDYCSCHYRYLLLLIFIYFYFRGSLNTLIHWKHSLKSANYLSNVKKSNTETMEEVNWKKNLTLWCLDIMRSILTSHLKVIKTPQNVHKMCFWCVLMTFICEVKIDLIMSRHHYVKSIFLLTSSIVQVFDLLTSDK